MNSTFSPDIREIVATAHYRPAISIIMPFDPKISLRDELLHRLKFASGRIEQEIRKDYPKEICDVVMAKLKKTIRDINISTYKKSLAIYLSPIFEKVLYLDIPVEEKIIIDESFEIRDLVYAKKEEQRYVVLLVSGKCSKVFLGNSYDLVKIKTDIPDNIDAFKHDLPERVANFSDPSSVKENLLKRFLQHTDDGLKNLLKAYLLPAFVLGSKKAIGYFKGLTKNEKNIAGYISGNYEEYSESELSKVLKPYINDWKKVKLENLHAQLEKAANHGRLATGIQHVWKQAIRKKGNLLVVEKNYIYSAQLGREKDIIEKVEEPYNKFSCIRDAVDDIIEKVLENGGDVEFVNDGSLDKYQQIALIQYY